MFEEPLKKAEEAITRMNKTLTLFEKECGALKVKYLEDLMDLQTKSEQQLKGFQDQMLKVSSDYGKEFEAIFSVQMDKLSNLAAANLDSFSQDVKRRFESVYSVYEKEVIDRMGQVFESDLEKTFEKYGDRLAPVIFKALIRYIFRIKSKPKVV